MLPSKNLCAAQFTISFQAFIGERGQRALHTKSSSGGSSVPEMASHFNYYLASVDGVLSWIAFGMIVILQNFVEFQILVTSFSFFGIVELFFNVLIFFYFIGLWWFVAKWWKFQFEFRHNFMPKFVGCLLHFWEFFVGRYFWTFVWFVTSLGFNFYGIF